LLNRVAIGGLDQLLALLLEHIRCSLATTLSTLGNVLDYSADTLSSLLHSSADVLTHLLHRLGDVLCLLADR
jgi:hypothetical protein